jgi:hypothetical protein
MRYLKYPLKKLRRCSMEKDEVIKMAIKAGYGPISADIHAKALQQFAILVAKAERKACAKMCEAYIAGGIGREMAAAIRARGKHE